MKKENILYLVIVLLFIIVGIEGYFLTKNDTDKIKNSNVTMMNKSQQMSQELQKLYSTNPFAQMQQLQAEMERVFNSMNSQFAMIPEFKDFFNDVTIAPSVNMKDLKDRYEIRVNIPGSDKNSIKVSTKNGILKIEAKTEKKVNEKKDNFIRKEIYSGSFLREIPLPNDADSEKITTEYKNGVLLVTVPKI